MLVPRSEEREQLAGEALRAFRKVRVRAVERDTRFRRVRYDDLKTVVLRELKIFVILGI